jgi:DNA-damage-inducible protein J
MATTVKKLTRQARSGDKVVLREGSASSGLNVRSKDTATSIKRKHADVSSEMLHLRIDKPLKTEAAKTLKHIGFSVSEAVRLFLHRVVVEQAMPLTLDVPNARTRAAMEEIDGGKLRKYASPKELFDDLAEGGK